MPLPRLGRANHWSHGTRTAGLRLPENRDLRRTEGRESGMLKSGGLVQQETRFPGQRRARLAEPLTRFRLLRLVIAVMGAGPIMFFAACAGDRERITGPVTIPSLNYAGDCENEGDPAWTTAERAAICEAIEQITNGCPSIGESLMWLWEGDHILKGDSVAMNQTRTSGSWDDGKATINPGITDELAELRATLREEWSHMMSYGYGDDAWHDRVHDWAETDGCDPPKRTPGTSLE